MEIAEPGKAVQPAGKAGWRIRMPAYFYIFALAGLTVFHAIRCFLLLDVCPMRYDESWTFLFYILPDGPLGWFNYSAPNNHVFHTLLASLSTAAFGDAPAALRFPAYLAGVAIVPATAWLARRLRASRPAAILAAAMIVQSVALAEYTVNARGYSMVCLASVLMAGCTLSIITDPLRLRTWIFWSLLATLGLFTIPVMLYPIAIMSAIILVHFIFFTDRSWLKKVLLRLAVSLAAVGAATCLLYLPVVICTTGGVEAITSNRYVAPIPISEVTSGLPSAAEQTLKEWTCGLNWLWMLMTGAGLAAAVVWAVRSHKAFCLLPVLGPVLLAGFALTQRVVPFARVWLFILPLLAAVCVWGLFKLTSFADRRQESASPWFIIFFIAVLQCGDAVGTAARTGLADPGDKDTIRDARQIVRDLIDNKMNDTAIVSMRISRWPLAYYEAVYRSQTMQYENIYEVVDFSRPRYKSALIVVGRGQSLKDLLDEKPGFTKRYDQPKLWRSYPGCDTFIAERKSPTTAP